MKQMRKLAAAVYCLAFAPAAAHAYSALYVFGDSLSDAGNLYSYTSTEPAPPYYNGAFSNGPNWIQDLSGALGLGPVAPSNLHGNDYAWGGATTGYSATVSPAVPVPTLTAQVGLFLAAYSGVAPSSGLYAVWIGSNDVFNIISNGASGLVAAQAAQGAAQTEATAIGALASAGARNFLVPLVGDLGTTPTLSSNALAAAAGSALALAYDNALEADLATLAGTPGIDLNFLNTYTLLDGAVADPSVYGFTSVTAACYTGTYFGNADSPGATECADPNQYLFWDQLHPTAAAQEIIATAAFDEVPEPGTLMVLGSGLAGLALLRRRPTMPA